MSAISGGSGRLILAMAALLGWSVGGHAQSPPGLELLSAEHRGLSFEVQMQGPVEHQVLGQSSGDLASWNSGAASTEVLRGLYRFVDADASASDRSFYRMQDNGPVVPGAWADQYPVTPLNFGRAGISPLFAWIPYPHAGPVDYELKVYEFEVASGGRLVLPSGPIMSVGGLIEPAYSWNDADPTLSPARLYAYTVTANVAGLQDIGTTVFFVPFGGDGASQPTDWTRLMELLKAMQDELAKLKSELGSNPLIAEIKLIEHLVVILGNYDLLEDYLIAILNGEIDKLIDQALSAETVIKLLCFLEGAAEVLALDQPDGSATKNALVTFKNGVKALKDRVETAENLAEELADIWNELESLGQAMRDVITDPLQFFLEAAKDKFVEKLKDILVCKFGKAAAGSLVSIAVHLAVFADALITLDSIQTLELEINRLLLEGIANSHSRDVFNPSGSFVFPLQPGQEDCDITIAFKKLCFVPTPDTGDSPHAGTWGPAADVPYADGSGSKTMKGSEYPAVADSKLSPPPRFCSTPKMPVPCSEGPCVIYVEVTIACPGRPPRTYRIFVGVVKACP